MLHPIMPFVTEEIYHILQERKDGDDIVIARYPETMDADSTAIAQGETAKEIISTIRDIRNKNNIKPKDKIKLFVKTDDFSSYEPFKNSIIKLASLETFEQTSEDVENAISFIANTENFFIEAGNVIDIEKEKERMLKELEYNRGFLKSVGKKLQNERFVQNAPAAVVEKERQKMADAEAKIKILEEGLAKL